MQLITEKIHESLIYDSLYGNIVEGYDASEAEWNVDTGISEDGYPKHLYLTRYLMDEGIDKLSDCFLKANLKTSKERCMRDYTGFSDAEMKDMGIVGNRLRKELIDGLGDRLQIIQDKFLVKSGRVPNLIFPHPDNVEYAKFIKSNYKEVGDILQPIAQEIINCGKARKMAEWYKDRLASVIRFAYWIAFLKKNKIISDSMRLSQCLQDSEISYLFNECLMYRSGGPNIYDSTFKKVVLACMGQ